MWKSIATIDHPCGPICIHVVIHPALQHHLTVPDEEEVEEEEDDVDQLGYLIAYPTEPNSKFNIIVINCCCYY